MAKAVAGRTPAYIAAAIVVLVTILWAVSFLPRLGRQPEAIKDGAADSSRTFFKFLLAAAVVLVVCFILSQFGGRVIIGTASVLLYLAAGLVLFHSFMVFNGAVFFLQEYERFSSEAILMLITVGANLIAAILAFIAGNTYRKFALPRAGEGPDRPDHAAGAAGTEGVAVGPGTSRRKAS